MLALITDVASTQVVEGSRSSYVLLEIIRLAMALITYVQCSGRQVGDGAF